MYKPPIALTGHAQSGKDTVADYLVEKYGYTKQSFAGPLKLELAVILTRASQGRALEEVLQLIEASKMHSEQAPKGWARLLLKGWGEFRKEMEGDDYWIKRAEFGEGIVITDVRFDPEYEEIRKRDIPLWRISRNQKSRVTDYKHASEALIDLFPVDVNIDNNTTLTYLYEQIDILMAELLKERN